MSKNNQHRYFSVSTLIDKLLSRRVLANLSEDERAELQEDLQVVRRLLGEQRTPRIAVVGPAGLSFPAVVKSILGESLDGDPTVKERLGRRRWYDYSSSRGTLRLLDLRAETDLHEEAGLHEESGLHDEKAHEMTTQAVSREQPDLVLFLWRPDHDQQPDNAQVERLEAIIEQAQATWGETPPTVAAIVEPVDTGFFDAGFFDTGAAESELRRQLVASTIPNESFDVALRAEESNLVGLMVRRAPMEVRVQLAHLTWVREIKRDVAESVVRAASGIAGAIASVPIPVADIVPLTALQVSMVAVVAHISGRELTLRTAWEFALATGANVGLGLAFRGVARTTVRFIPLAGSVIAAGIASTATYTMGRGAIAYFIGERR
jgi:uncharacterized protein (DUF697 family)